MSDVDFVYLPIFAYSSIFWLNDAPAFVETYPDCAPLNSVVVVLEIKPWWDNQFGWSGFLISWLTSQVICFFCRPLFRIEREDTLTSSFRLLRDMVDWFDCSALLESKWISACWDFEFWCTYRYGSQSLFWNGQLWLWKCDMSFYNISVIPMYPGNLYCGIR